MQEFPRLQTEPLHFIQAGLRRLTPPVPAVLLRLLGMTRDDQLECHGTISHLPRSARAPRVADRTPPVSNRAMR